MAIMKGRSSTDSDDTRSSAAAGEVSAVVASLGDDVMAEIILRLPVDSVARSKCVSKAWRATVSDGYLRRRLPLQLSVVYFPDAAAASARGKARPRFACADSSAGGAAAGGGMLRDRDLGFFPFLDVSVVSDACNGLLLLRAAGTRRFYVVDPVTRRWAALPPPSKDPRLSMLAFDPSSSSSAASRRGGGYHVVNFTGRWRDRGGEVEVYSSETRAWALRDAEFGVPAASLSGSVHFHAGVVYVLASDPDCVVRMDVAAGGGGGGLACAVAELPEPADGGDGRLAHSAGRLHYVACAGAPALLLKVWVLDGEPPALRWRLKHAVQLGDVVVEGGRWGSEARVLALHPEKDAVYVWSAWKRQLLEYDLARKEVTGAWAFGEGDRNRVVKTWLVPSSMYLSDCLPLPDAHVQQC